MLVTPIQHLQEVFPPVFIQDEANTVAHFTVLGRPTPQPRPMFVMRGGARGGGGQRTGRGRFVGHVFNPGRRHRAAFERDVRDQVRRALESQGIAFPAAGTLFQDRRARLAVEIAFRTRRPNSHFINGNRDRPLIAGHEDDIPTGGDIDNFAKFVLDAMNNLIFPDDRHVVALVLTRLWAEDPNSNGSTTVVVKHAY